MDKLRTEEMLSFIRNFLSTIKDYDPVFDDKNGDVIGCLNTKYHGNMFQTVVNPPINDETGASYPKLIIAYLLLKNGDIIVCDGSLKSYNLVECLSDSIERVYEEIVSANRTKDEYERNERTKGL